MRVYNLTDVPTPTLERHGLVNQSIVAHRRVVAPGEYVEVETSESMKVRLSHLLTVGAVSIDQLPPAYLRARQLAVPSTGHLGVIPVRHLDMQETPVLGVSKVPPPPPVTTTAPTVVLRSKKKGRS